MAAEGNGVVRRGGGAAPATNGPAPTERRRRSKEKKSRDRDAYRHVPGLDHVLTGAFVALGMASVYLLDRDDLSVLALSSVGTVAILNATKWLCRVAAPFIGTKTAVSKPRNVRKFADQGWQLVVHSSMVALEVAILNVDNWQTYHDPRLAWVNMAPVHPLTRALYLVQLGVWLYTTFSHRFLEARHKDYYVMYVHHIATISLVLGSYTNTFTKIGVLVLFVHDASDIFMDLLKMTNYMGLDSASGLFLTEIVFVMNLVSWGVSRLWIFPRKFVWSAWFESVHVFNELPGREAGAHLLEDAYLLLRDGRVQDSVLRVALVVLWILHCWWFFLLLRIAVKLLRGNQAKNVGAEEYEGASSDSEAEPTKPAS